MHTTNFTPGPSQLYFTVPDHLRKALREQIPSLSHRSKHFEAIYKRVDEGLRTLLAIPDNFYITFTGSATEIWERSLQNLVIEHSHHYVNGAFSNRFFEIANQLNKKPTQTFAIDGEGFTQVETNAELIAITHNETSTGVMLPVDFIQHRNGNAIRIVDAVSSLPYAAFDFNKIDSIFFSVQKGFGLPAGLGVWIFNERCVERAQHIQKTGVSIGSYHTIPSLVSHARKFQTPETPNVLGIYLLANVIEDFLRRGIETIRRETEYKAAILYQVFDNHPLVKAFVHDKNIRSKTVIVADCGEHTNLIHEKLLAKGLQAGEGYGKFKSSQLRFANFPAHSKEQFELLVDTLQEIR